MKGFNSVHLLIAALAAMSSAIPFGLISIPPRELHDALGTRGHTETLSQLAKRGDQAFELVGFDIAACSLEGVSMPKTGGD